MRRIAAVFLLLLLIAYLGLGVSAATGISAMSGFATVNTDGGCQIALTVTLHLEQAVDKLYFPIPAAATGVTLNGSRVSAPREGDVRNVNLSRLTRKVVGDVTVSLQYSLYDVIATMDNGALEMQLPMLSGFAYPIEKWPYPIANSNDALVQAIRSFDESDYKNRVAEHLRDAVAYDNGTASEQAVNLIAKYCFKKKK